uniref:Uncharacterized protein n=1 Tax=Rhizophora mucronata TaxID=61149 RepID=A0A2P2QNR0_RHIMU
MGKIMMFKSSRNMLHLPSCSLMLQS